MFTEPTGGAAKPYKAKKRRMPKMAASFAKTKQMARYRKVKSAPVKSRLTGKTPLSPKVGNLGSQSMTPLPAVERKAAMNKKQKSPYQQERRSRAYTAAAKRTKAKFSRRAR